MSTESAGGIEGVGGELYSRVVGPDGVHGGVPAGHQLHVEVPELEELSVEREMLTCQALNHFSRGRRRPTGLDTVRGGGWTGEGQTGGPQPGERGLLF